jgi:virulence-associated protein VagC
MYIPAYILTVMKDVTTVFASGNSYAVRLIGACKLPKGTRVREIRDGKRIILEPVDEWPDEFLEMLGTWTEDIPRPDPGMLNDPFTDLPSDI